VYVGDGLGVYVGDGDGGGLGEWLGCGVWVGAGDRWRWCVGTTATGEGGGGIWRAHFGG
jgi:hypothetical protein